MKKMIATILCAMMLTLTACGMNGDAPMETTADMTKFVTVQSLNGNGEKISVEVPFDPRRVAVLDMPALDILDALDLGDRIVGSAKVSIDYLARYNPDDSDGKIMNLGTVKTADLEKVAASEPDVIFIGSRLASVCQDLEAIAPVVCLAVDYEKGVVESTEDNVRTVASIFGREGAVDDLLAGFRPRIQALNGVLSGHDMLLTMYNSNAVSIMDTRSQLNILAAELGGNNLGETVGETDKATHGEDASWETVIRLDPEYIFVLDRNSAVASGEEGVSEAQEAFENELIRQLDAYKEGKIIYFTKNAAIWYTATGGVQALDIMLTDLEDALLPDHDGN